MKYTRALLLVFLLAGCTSRVQPHLADTVVAPRQLTVFAAASLTDAFTELGKNFESANPGVTVTFNFAGSQALRTQIEEGAPVDVFASANTKEMNALITSGLVAETAPQIFLTNQLMLILPADNPAQLNSLQDLANAGVKIIFAAPDVPIGNYTRQAIDLMATSFGTNFRDNVFANVVSNEDNVRQVVAKVQLGEADAGIVYTSDAVAAPELQTLSIPNEFNVIAAYPLAPLSDAPHPDLAQAFIQYVLSADGQAILKKWGFAPAP